MTERLARDKTRRIGSVLEARRGEVHGWLLEKILRARTRGVPTTVQTKLF